MNLQPITNVYFIGIGGIGMSALARYFNANGKVVAGYDRTSTDITEMLEKEGIKVHFTDEVEAIPASFKNTTTTLVVYTPAIPKDHKELTFFQDNGYQVVKRSEVLGFITKNSFCLAVAGTHGKTTTSSILAHIMVESGASVSAFLGGIAENFNSNLVLKGSEYTVVEADEFDRSFLRLSPNIACITSMDADHLDIYGDEQHLIEGFHEFAGKIKPGGSLIVRNGLNIAGETYGLEDNSDYSFQNIHIVYGIYHFDFKYAGGIYKDITFMKPGRHNLLNALAAIAMAVKAGIAPEKLLPHLATFRGVKRRFSYIIKEKDFVFIDDYAHHPSEINALYQAVTEMYPNTPKTIVFQPHLFTRTRDFMNDFAKSLSQFDEVILLDIYPARELPIEGITSQVLLEKITTSKKTLVSKTELIPLLLKKRPQLLLAVGAGDIGAEVAHIKEAMKK
ncbi:UDP-N-acetylmuramate--L-alanine ligase [Capnocytophaga genosp. AHN8471]|uniref:UDP-N-acetylmuramate--L-alanine ligase n=1 Tax=Capnocytophaga genosp. AHN8471 TaxID=327574 RepID=UPI00193222A1|nr:UDP-N-acetylmuramate--L-alanine ligase [Capnocytophaga genosp. AHN8471]MBM0657795.1 UDP-N-acetylmuramate--L-alanine ligase [Capnocytophaga genosp. AHN8471]